MVHIAANKGSGVFLLQCNNHLIHAVWCITTGSDTIQRLNKIMVEQRRLKGQDVTQMLTVDWVI